MMMMMMMMMMIIIIIMVTKSTKLRNYKNRHIGHSTHTAESANVKVHNIFYGEITLHAAQIVNGEQLQHYVP